MRPRNLAPRIMAVVLSACLILPPHAYALRPQQQETEPQRTGLEEALRSGDSAALIQMASSRLAQQVLTPAVAPAVSPVGLEEEVRHYFRKYLSRQEQSRNALPVDSFPRREGKINRRTLLALLAAGSATALAGAWLVSQHPERVQETVKKISPPLIFPGLPARPPGLASIDTSDPQLQRHLQDLVDVIVAVEKESHSRKSVDLTGIVEAAEKINSRFSSSFPLEQLRDGRARQFNTLLREVQVQVFIPAGELFFFAPDKQGGQFRPVRWSVNDSSWRRVPYLNSGVWLADAGAGDPARDSLLGITFGRFAFVHSEFAKEQSASERRVVMTQPFPADSTPGRLKSLLERVAAEDYMQYIGDGFIRYEELRHAQDIAFAELKLRSDLSSDPRAIAQTVEVLLKPDSSLRKSIWEVEEFRLDEVREEKSALALFEYAGQLGSAIRLMEVFLESGQEDLAYAAFLRFVVIQTGAAQEDVVGAMSQYAMVGRLLVEDFKKMGFDMRFLINSLPRSLEAEHGTPAFAAMVLLQRIYQSHFWTDEEREKLLKISPAGLEESLRKNLESQLKSRKVQLDRLNQDIADAPRTVEQEVQEFSAQTMSGVTWRREIVPDPTYIGLLEREKDKIEREIERLSLKLKDQSSGAGLEEPERLGFKLSLQTFGTWGSVRRILRGYNSIDQSSLRDMLYQMVRNIVRDGSVRAARYALSYGVPELAKANVTVQELNEKLPSLERLAIALSKNPMLVWRRVSREEFAELTRKALELDAEGRSYVVQVFPKKVTYRSEEITRNTGNWDDNLQPHPGLYETDTIWHREVIPQSIILSPQNLETADSDAAGLEENTPVKLTWRAWWATRGLWGRTKEEFLLLDREDQWSARGLVNAVVNRAVQRRVPTQHLLQFGIPALLHSQRGIVALQSSLIELERLNGRLAQEPMLVFEKISGKEYVQLTEEAVLFHQKKTEYRLEVTPEKSHEVTGYWGPEGLLSKEQARKVQYSEGLSGSDYAPDRPGYYYLGSHEVGWTTGRVIDSPQVVRLIRTEDRVGLPAEPEPGPSTGSGRTEESLPRTEATQLPVPAPPAVRGELVEPPASVEETTLPIWVEEFEERQLIVLPPAAAADGRYPGLDSVVGQIRSVGKLSFLILPADQAAIDQLVADLAVETMRTAIHEFGVENDPWLNHFDKMAQGAGDAFNILPRNPLEGPNFRAVMRQILSNVSDIDLQYITDAELDAVAAALGLSSQV